MSDNCTSGKVPVQLPDHASRSISSAVHLGGQKITSVPGNNVGKASKSRMKYKFMSFEPQVSNTPAEILLQDFCNVEEPNSQFAKFQHYNSTEFTK